MATTQKQASEDNPVWMELFTSLHLLAKKRIYDAGLQAWHGQEYDLAEDVAQEAVVRTFLQTQKALRGEATPILSLFHFSKKVATNRLYDIARKDFRLVRPSNDTAVQEKMIADNWFDPTEEVLDEIDNASLFALIAHVIMDFPTKQRKALLIDLAIHSPVDEPFSPLQQALSNVGIRLEMYRDLLPRDAVARGRHNALLSLAYKRVKKVVCIRLQLQDQVCSA